jgi:hypothetical protein
MAFLDADVPQSAAMCRKLQFHHPWSLRLPGVIASLSEPCAVMWPSLQNENCVVGYKGCADLADPPTLSNKDKALKLLATGLTRAGKKGQKRGLGFGLE